MIVSEVLDLARHGLYTVRLHYPIFQGDKVLCSCGQQKCFSGDSQGKHPVGKEWGQSATDDPEIIMQNFGNGSWNVGIILGVGFGIPADQAVIDVEDDSREGRELADALLCDYPTPTYSSGKSLHRIYRWSHDLPDVSNDKGVMVINGLEFRMGGKDKQTQSVAPPSMHRTGVQYKWIEGKSLDDLPIAKLPQHVIEMLQEESARRANGHSKGGPHTNEQHKFRSPLGKVTPGSRHHTLLTYSNSLWRKQFQLYGINECFEVKSSNEVWMILAGANLLVCEPPKTDTEVEQIFRSSKLFMTKELLEEIEQKEADARKLTDPEPSDDEDDDTFGGWLHRHGIRLQNDRHLPPAEESPDRIDEWICDWRMEYLTKGDEELMAVHFHGINSPSLMRHPEFVIAKQFARRVQQDTQGKFCLDRTFIWWDWQTIWEGRPNDKKGKKGITRGLKEFLLNKAQVVEHKTQSLAEQIEDLIFAMAGSKSGVIDGVEQWKNARDENPEGRLKINAMGALCTIRAPEDPLTGWYLVEGELMLLVKMDELNRKYRSAYGNTVANRIIAEALIEKLKFEKKKFSTGATAGRWFIRDAKEIENND